MIKRKRDNSYAVYYILSVAVVVNTPRVAYNSESLLVAYVLCHQTSAPCVLRPMLKGQPRPVLTTERKAQFLQETWKLFGTDLTYDLSAWVPPAKASHPSLRLMGQES